ncbi:MAG: metal ABC transporter substrate-binding protein [Spirochaetia bacterium]|nr:metal ABC transporter substrate-binding protein [Spirochaetia bacterium]
MFSPGKISSLLAFAAVLFFSGACSHPTPGSAANPGGKKILTTFNILQDMAQNVAGGKALVSSITKPGAEIHDYEPTPLDIARARSADLILDNGMGLERWFEKFYGELKQVPHVVVTEGISPASIGEGSYSGKPNPHSWMSPANALIYIENIRKALVKLDPQNEASFNSNARNYAEEVRKVDLALRESLGKVAAEKRFLVTCEGAFSYLTRDYGFQELYLWPINSDAEGTPQQIKKVVDTVRSKKIPVIFSESTVSPKPMLQVARETGARYGGVLYVDSLSKEGGPAPTYLKLLEYNASVIIKGFLPDQGK